MKYDLSLYLTYLKKMIRRCLSIIVKTMKDGLKFIAYFFIIQLGYTPASFNNVYKGVVHGHPTAVLHILKCQNPMCSVLSWLYDMIAHELVSLDCIIPDFTSGLMTEQRRSTLLAMQRFGVAHNLHPNLALPECKTCA